MSIKAAQKYGYALFEVATEEDVADKILEELRLLDDAFQNEDLLTVLNHPEIEKEDKKELINKLFKDKLSHWMMNFLYVLIDKNRFSMIREIRICYEDLWYKMKKIERMTVISAIELSPERLEAIGRAYVGKGDVQIEVENKVDPSILGGVILEIGETRIDRSIRGELEEIKKRLTNNTH